MWAEVKGKNWVLLCLKPPLEASYQSNALKICEFGISLTESSH
jgi:hypothetical protein